MGQLIDLKEKHNTVLGMTGSGKTYTTAASLAGQRCPVLFFNTLLLGQGKFPQSFNNKFVAATAFNSWGQIEKGLRAGKKINFIPPIEHTKKEKLLILFIENLFKAGFTEENPVYLVVDEVHLYKKLSQEMCEMVSTSGRSLGVFGIWISQRPAKVSNTLMSQSEQFVMFETHMENKYFKSYDIPIEDIEQRLKKAGQYSYCTYDFREVKGAFKA